MGFVRHELGKRLRIKRIPALHIHLDDSAERGTRVLHLLSELEAGVDPQEITPVQRVPAHAGQAAAPRGRRGARGGRDAGRGRAARDPARAAPRAGRRPRRGPGGDARPARGAARPRRKPGGASPGAARGERAGRPRRPSPATPSRSALVERLRGARHVLAVSHEHPDADTLGAVLGICLIVEALGGRATAVCTDPVPPLYAFLPGIDRFRTDPDPAEAYDLLVLADCATAERVGDVAVRNAALFAALPRVIVDHHASNDAAGEADWIDPGAAATCELVALLAVRLGLPLDLGDRALADGADGRHRHGHGDLRPPQRDARARWPSRRRSWRPGRRCPTSRAASTGPSRTRSCACSGACWTGSRRRPTAG